MSPALETPAPPLARTQSLARRPAVRARNTTAADHHDRLTLSARSREANGAPARDVTSEYRQVRDLPDGGRQVSFDYVTGEGVRILEEYRYDREGNLVERVLKRRRETTDPARFQHDGLHHFEEELITSEYDQKGKPRHTVTVREYGEAQGGASYDRHLTRHPDGEIEFEAVGRRPDGYEFALPYPLQIAPELPEPPPMSGGAPAFSLQEKVIELPDGGRRVVSELTDPVTGLVEHATTTYDRQGRPQKRVTETVRQAEHLEDDVDGLAVLAGLINNPQALLDSLGADLTQTEVHRIVEGFEPPSKTEAEITIWESPRGAVTRIEQEGHATRWEVKKQEGDRTLTQTFVEGSEDTSVTEAYRDQDGFEVVHTESDTRDLAEFSGDENVPEFSESTVATREGADLDDLRRLLGQDAFEELSRDSEAFNKLLRQFEKGDFTLAKVESRLEFGDGRQQDLEAITLAGEDGLAALVFDESTGRWTVSDLPQQAGGSGPDDTAELLSNPANVAAVALFGGSLSAQNAGRYLGWADNLLGPLGRRLGAPALGPLLGLAGGGLVAAAGLEEMANGDFYRGAFQLMAGGGAMVTSLAGLGSSMGLSAGAAAVLGPIGWALAGAGVGLGYVYDYMDRHRVADLVI